MRVTTVGAIILSALPFIAFAAEGDYCVIPKLEQGKPTIVDVSYIDNARPCSAKTAWSSR